MHTSLNDDLNDDFSSVILRAPNSYNPDKVSLANGVSFPEPTLTQQHEQDETDINFIIQRFTRTGILPEARVLPTYGDFTSEATDYQSALHLIKQADDAFASLPAQLRAHFRHDPAAFMEFMNNDPDPQLLLDLGIADRVSTGRETQPDPTAPPAPEPEST
jgi:Chlamydia-phage Chp2 scaffold (Chlamy_scaf)